MAPDAPTVTFVDVGKILFHAVESELNTEVPDMVSK
jgi:hypothetical protein